MGSVATITPAALPVEPGGQAVFQVRLRNTGKIVDQFSFELLGDARDWGAVEPPTISLFPNDEGTVAITFRPPHESDVPAGPCPVGVRITSKEDAAHPSVEELTIVLGRVASTTAELVPRTVRGSRRAVTNLAVDNRGNARLNANLTAANPDDLASFALNPPALVVEPTQAAFARVVVVPRKRFLRGPNVTVPFQVKVEPEGGPPVVADGAMLQEPLLPAWLPRALLALLALLLALALIFFVLVKPSIKTEARNAVRDDVSPALRQLSGQIGDLAKAAGATPPPPVTSGGGGGGGSGGGDATTSAASDTALGGTPVSGRLSIKADQADQSYSPSNDQDLRLTDVVLENPEADTGRLTVQNDGNDLLVVRLENFRDLDYHFVAPIIVKSGKNLTIKVECQNADVNKKCSPALLYSGALSKPA